MADKNGVEKDGIETGRIDCASGGTAYFARPKAPGDYPCMVLFHERYGLVQHTLDLIDRFAGDGFVAVAPDLFFRHPDVAAVNRGDARCDVTDPQVADDAEAAIAALSGIEGADTSRLFAMGVCQSGRWPLVLASRRSLSACLVFYGAASDREWEVNEEYPEALEDLMGRIECPVLGIFGEADHVIPIEGVLKFRDVLEAKRKSFQIHIYPDVPHGWLNDTMPGRYRRDAAEMAWAEMISFCGDVMDGNFPPGRVLWEFTADSGSGYDFTNNVRLA